MEIITSAAGAGDAVVDEISGDGIQCCNHSTSNNASDGGICALCLQDKLGKLVKSSSTSFSIGSASPSFRSDPSTAGEIGFGSNSASLSLRPAIAAPASSSSSSNSQFQGDSTTGPAKPAHATRRAHFPFPFSHRETENVKAKRRRFWSFFYHSKALPPSTDGVSKTAVSVMQNGVVPQVNNEASATTSFGRKAISRSRSVGCGSRSFSGDFFERISTGFGGCTLRRVESQREGKRSSSTSAARAGGGDVIKERVRCGGIFSGFMMTSSSSSSSSSFRISSSTASEEANNEKASSEAAAIPAAQGRSRGRGWAFASPMRVFGRSSMKEVKTTTIKAKPSPNLAEIPSLLTARG